MHGPFATGNPPGSARCAEEVGAVAVVVLVLFALVWVTVRVVVALRVVLSGDDRAAPRAPSPQDRPTPQDAVVRPQDAPSRLRSGRAYGGVRG